jgi:Uma2 family endonuclease
MSAPGRRLELTVEDLHAMPEDGYAYELQGGLLVREPLPGFRHGRVMLRVGELLSAHARAHRLGVVIVGDSGFILARTPDTVRGPDVAFVSQARFEQQGDTVRAFCGAPDLAVEIVSPSTRPSPRTRRSPSTSPPALGACG